MFHVIEILDKIRKGLRFLTECLSPWIAMKRRDPVQHDVTPDYNGCIIGVEENDDNKILIFKECEKREWLAGSILNSDDSTIGILDADYEDIDSLHNLDVTNTVDGKTC